MRVLILAALLGTPAAAADLTVNLTGVKKTQGNLVVCLWNQGDKFPNCEEGRPVQRLAVPAAIPTVTFKDVAPGSYAVSAFHDANGNNKMDTNFVGLPLEAVGLSNNPKAGFGPPRYKASVFKVDGNAAITLKLATM